MFYNTILDEFSSKDRSSYIKKGFLKAAIPALLTENAKNQLNIEYNNIQARIVKLLESFEEKKK